MLTVFYALDDRGRRIAARSAIRGEPYHCEYHGLPEHSVFPRFPRLSGREPHFVHQSHSGCPLATEEGNVQADLASVARQLFRPYGIGRPAYEAGADAFLVRGRFAVECSAFGLDRTEFFRRTRAHNRQGNGVIWVWDLALVGYQRLAELAPGTQIDVPEGISIAHYRWGARAYLVSRAGEVAACRWANVRDATVLGGWTHFWVQSERLVAEPPALGPSMPSERMRWPLSRPLWLVPYGGEMVPQAQLRAGVPPVAPPPPPPPGPPGGSPATPTPASARPAPITITPATAPPPS